jgi:acyl-CoA synthetase (AMP-forming)/AMP-acid ligase II/acyl carrier protein
MRIKVPQSDHICSSLLDIIYYRATTQPNTLAYHFFADSHNHEPVTITYGVLFQKILAISAAIQQEGIVPGERVLLIYPPGIELIAAFWGCLYAGTTSVIVYPPFNDYLVNKLQCVILDSQPRFLLSTVEIIQQFKQLKLLKKIAHVPFIKKIVKHYLPHHVGLTEWSLENLSWLTTDDIAPHKIVSYQERTIEPDDIAFLQYTSGSTNHPKGVKITHGNLVDNLEIIHKNFGEKSHVGVIWLPPYHDMGLIGGIIQPLYLGSPCLLMSPLTFLQNPFFWLQLISKYRATIGGGPNFAYDYCVKKITPAQKATLDLSSWEIAFNGAEPIYADVLERFYQAFKECGFRKEALFPCYGLAEATLCVSGSSYLQGYNSQSVSTLALRKHRVEPVAASSPDSSLLVSSGRPYQEVRIVNSKTHQLCAPDEVGEIWVHGKSVAPGYWQNEKATHATFAACIADDASQTSYLRTGDLGFLLDGHLYITGRLKDLIIIYGINYYPQDIEYTVSHCDPLIRSGGCAAFSVINNETERLVVVCEVKNLSQNAEAMYSELCHTISKAIALQHELDIFTIMLIPPRKLAKTTSGKLRRQHIKAQFENQQLASLYLWNENLHTDIPLTIEESSPEQLETVLSNLYEEVIGVPIGIDENVFGLGADSVQCLMLLNRINHHYNINLDLNSVMIYPTVREIAKLVRDHIEPQK